MIYAQNELMPWVVATLRGQDLDLFDAHVHVGVHDPAGLEVMAEEAVGALEQVGSRALVFPLKEPSGYRDYNRQVIELAAAHPDRLGALCRLDPADEPRAELERSLERGAVGIKLHPRGEAFAISDPRLDTTFALADERRLPIMIHAGVGYPEVGLETLERARRHPGARFILAHCGIGAYEGIVSEVDGVPNVLFDTSWWNPADVWALFRTVRPSQILYASDIPFASPALALIMTVRIALQAGLDAERLHAVMGGQLDRLVQHAELLELAPLDHQPEPLASELERLYVTLCSAVEPMLRGEDPGQGFELAKTACSAPAGPFAHIIESVAQLLELAENATALDPLRPLRAPGFDLVLAAAVVARTPAAPVP